jgi:hypothetical protein
MIASIAIFATVTNLTKPCKIISLIIPKNNNSRGFGGGGIIYILLYQMGHLTTEITSIDLVRFEYQCDFSNPKPVDSNEF